MFTIQREIWWNPEKFLKTALWIFSAEDSFLRFRSFTLFAKPNCSQSLLYRATGGQFKDLRGIRVFAHLWQDLGTSENSVHSNQHHCRFLSLQHKEEQNTNTKFDEKKKQFCQFCTKPNFEEKHQWQVQNHAPHAFVFLIARGFLVIVSQVVSAPHFNLPWAQLSIFICNSSFPPPPPLPLRYAASLSCLLSRHSRCVSALMEFQSYSFRCSCFPPYLMSLTASLPSRVPHLFLDLPPCAASDFLPPYLLFSFSPSRSTNCIVPSNSGLLAVALPKHLAFVALFFCLRSILNV